MEWLQIAGATGGWAAAFSLAWLIVSSFVRGKLPTPREAEAQQQRIAKLEQQNEDLRKQNHDVVYELLPVMNKLLDSLREAAEK